MAIMSCVYENRNTAISPTEVPCCAVIGGTIYPNNNHEIETDDNEFPTFTL